MLSVFALLIVAATPAPTPDPCFHGASASTVVAPGAPHDYYVAKRITATVKLTIKADGTIGGGGIVTSSGSADFDAQTESAAQQSRFSPKVFGCKPAESVMFFQATFDPASRLVYVRVYPQPENG